MDLKYRIKRKKFFALIVLFILTILVLTVTLASCKIIDTLGSVEVSDEDSNKKSDESAAQKVSAQEVPAVEEGQDEDALEKNPIKFWLDDSIPDYMSSVLKQQLEECYQELEFVYSKVNSDINIEIKLADKSSTNFFVFTPVVSFFTVLDDISWEEFKKFWNGDENSLMFTRDSETDPYLIISEDTLNVLQVVLGECKNNNLEISAREDILSNIKENPNNFSIIPFNEIIPEYKVLTLDGMSILNKDINILEYPLTLSINISGSNPELVDEVENNLEETFNANRNIEKLATINMTGVTAPAQGKTIGNRMNEYGPLYPAEKIVDVLLDADITHISNEIPFMENCTGSRYIETGDCVFCCKPEHVELLKFVGTDVVELTGNHMNDFGSEWMHFTLDIYEEEGWPYFGGGRNFEDSLEPAVLEVNGNKFAFLGANTFGPEYNWATEDNPGSARINVYDEIEMEEDFQRFENIIKELKQDGYIVIFTFQYTETYNYLPFEQQIIDFRRIIDAGADIVSGSQSHQPMGVEFRGDGFINYGLGNLFFNQANELVKKQGIIAKHIFYEGRHINTILITTMLENLSQPRITTPEERAELLKAIFNGSIK